MSIWKRLAKLAEDMDARAAKRKLKGKPLSAVAVYNRVDSLEGAIGKMFAHSGSIIIQNISETTNRAFNNFTQVWAEIVDKKLDDVSTGMEQYFRTYNAAAELRHQEFFKGMNGLVDCLETNDRNHGGRYVEIQNRLSQLEGGQIETFKVLHGTMVGLYENTIEHLQRIERRLATPQVVHEPTLDWLIDNADELKRFVDAIQHYRSNNEPPETAIVPVVKSVRLLLNDAPMHDAKKAIEEWAA